MPVSGAAAAHDIDDFGIDARPYRSRLMSVPFQVVVGFAAGHHDRKLAHVSVQCSRHCRVVKIKQSFGDGRVVCGEGQRPAQYACGTAAGQNVENLLARFIQIFALAGTEAGPANPD